MSIFTQYHPETGVVFDEVDDLLKPSTGGGGGATPTATATPKATSTPVASKFVHQFPDGKWYVTDAQLTPISEGFRTQSMAITEATRLQQQGAFAPTSTPMPTATPTPQGNPNATAANPQFGSMADAAFATDTMNMASASGGSGASTMGPAGRTAAQVAGTAYLSDAEAEWYRALPMSVKAAVEGGRTGGTSGGSTATGTAGGTATSAKPPTAPPEIQGLLDSFEGFSDKDVVEAYYKGEIDRDQLAALITVRNTSDKGVPKYTTASLDRYLTQVDADKPVPKRTAMDVLGERFGNISRQYNPNDPSFGAKGTFGSQGQSTPGQRLFTPQSEGEGLVPYTNPGGSQGLAATVVNNQLFPNIGATNPSGMVGEGQLNYSGSPASILAQSGLYVDPRTSPAAQMQALGNLIALREFIMQNNPGASPSQVNDAAVSMMQPANPNHDPSAGSFANLSDPLSTMPQFARGGSMMLKEPVMGMGMYSRKPLFMAAEAGNQERVESDGKGLKFTPTAKPYVSKWQPTRSTPLPAMANPMAQSRAFGQRGQEMGMPQVGLPVEGRTNGRTPTSSMMALMRMLGVQGFAEGGYARIDEYPAWHHTTDGTATRMFGSGEYPSYGLDAIGLGTSIEGGQIAPQSFLNAAASELQHQQTLTRQTELDAYKAALNDVAGISNVARLQSQRNAYDPRFGGAGMRTPSEFQAPLTGQMGALPPGARWALESPAERMSRLTNLNEQQRGLDLSKLQNPSQQTQLALRDAISSRDEDEIAALLGIDPDLVETIFNLLNTEGGGGGGSPGQYPGYPIGGLGGWS